VRLGAAVAVVVLAALAAAVSAGAHNECHGIRQCISVSGPWVVVQAGAETDYLQSCGKQGVVGGVDADVTSTAVRLSFDGRLGAPVSPGVTTTVKVLYRGRLVTGARGAFQPWVGCIPASGGGGRSTVSARVTSPGPALDRVARTIVVSPGEVKTASLSCPSPEKLVGAWHAVAFRTKKPPDLADAARVQAAHRIAGKKVVLTVEATDALSIDAHAVVQVGVECAL
jgi:hypothetical protein